MKPLAGVTVFLALGAFAGALVVSCADPPRPANSAQNPPRAASDPGTASDPGAASNKDGGGGGGW